MRTCWKCGQKYDDADDAGGICQTCWDAMETKMREEMMEG